MTRQTLKTSGLPIGNPDTSVHYDPVTAMIVGSVATAGAGAYTAREARKDAKKEAAKQQALIAEQERKIQAEKEKQLKEQQARRQRAGTQELLTGTETGITGAPAGSLLTPKTEQ